MIVNVEMWAFMRGRFREVEVPDGEWRAAKTTREQLELAFLYGQNDVQPQALPSVSVRDVIQHPWEGRYSVLGDGFRRL